MRERGRVAKTVLVLVLLVLYAPLVFLVVASFNKNPASTQWQGFTTQWYRKAFDDVSLRRSVGVSIRLAALASLGAVAAGTLAAIAARRSRWLGRVNTLFATVRVATYWSHRRDEPLGYHQLSDISERVRWPSFSTVSPDPAPESCSKVFYHPFSTRW